MSAVIIFVITLLVLAAISVLAFRSTPEGAMLPMQWGLSGKPTWSAPRWLAVWFTPALAALVLGAVAFAGRDAGGFLLLALAPSAALFTIIHAAHLYFAVRHAKREASQPGRAR